MTAINRAKLTRQNRVGIHPVSDYGDGTFATCKGFVFVGFCAPPWVGSGPDAVVYEKIDHGEEMFEHLDLGMHWGHGDRTKMNFNR